MCSYPTRNKNSKNIVKKFKKLEKTIIASFPAKIGWGRPRKRENKKNLSDVFLPDQEQKIPKKKQKNSKYQKTPSQLLFKTKQVGKGREREKIKKESFQRVPTRPVIENSKKNCKKIQEITKHHQSFISIQNRLAKAQKGRK